MRLGNDEVAGLVCPPGRRDVLVFDDALPGFGVRVTAEGARVFLFQYRQGSAVRRLTLGRFGEVTPARARKLAEAARGRVAEGGDPAAERKAARAARLAAEAEARRRAQIEVLTVSALLDRWAELGLRDRSASHQGEAPRAIRACFTNLLPIPATEVDAAAAQREVDALTRTRPVMARRARDYVRAMFNWAVKRRLVPTNPFAGVVIEARERARNRVLSDAELGEAWRAAAALGHPFGPFVRVLILTLQRRGEVAGMRWTELAPDLSTWTIPAERAKNGKAHVVHLAEPVRAILRALPRFKGCPLVFTSMTAPRRKDVEAARTADQPPQRARTAPVQLQGFSAAAERLHAAILKERRETAAGSTEHANAAPDWRWHDFRRTGVTVLASKGVPPHVADRLLNHVQGTIKGVAAVYQRHEFMAERKAALEAWAGHVIGQGS